MQSAKRLKQFLSGILIVLLAAALFTGCHTTKDQCCAPAATTAEPATPAAVAAPAVTPAPPVAAPAPAPLPQPIRIKAGTTSSVTDSEGNVWLPDQGFADGETIERSDLQIANTKSPGIYQSERYSMTSFSHPVPNGKYTVKLHFAETYEGITATGQRVFSFNVEGQEFKDFDVWAKAGSGLTAYVETVNVEVTDGKLDITFTPNIENPEINGVEIISRP